MRLEDDETNEMLEFEFKLTREDSQEHKVQWTRYAGSIFSYSGFQNDQEGICCQLLLQALRIREKCHRLLGDIRKPDMHHIASEEGKLNFIPPRRDFGPFS